MRPMISPDDHPFLIQLFRTTREQELARVSDWDEQQIMEFVHFQWQAQLSHYEEHYPNATHHILGLKNGRTTTPIGRLYVEREPGLIRLMDIALLTEHRGKQIGTKLIEALLAEADKNNQTVRLFVFKENFGAHKLYKRLGFQDLGVEGGLYLKMERKSCR